MSVVSRSDEFRGVTDGAGCVTVLHDLPVRTETVRITPLETRYPPLDNVVAYRIAEIGLNAFVVRAYRTDTMAHLAWNPTRFLWQVTGVEVDS